jgi:nitrogenase molybdenum-iron protein alpha/beta subunit
VSVVHGPKGCTHHNFSLLHATALDNDVVHIPEMFSTGLAETEIIFGGEEALDRTLRSVSRLDPAAVFVLSTCAVETIGDDVRMVCSVPRGIPVIPVPTAGFLGGPFQEGVNNALIALAGMAGPAVANGGVNIIGEKNLEYEVNENFAEVVRLLDALGLPVNIRFVHDLNMDQLPRLGAAQLNILRDPALVPVGTYLCQRFGTPYIPSFPLGLSGSITFMESVAGACALDCRDATEKERALQEEMFCDFADLAGYTICVNPAVTDPDGLRKVLEVADALKLDITPSGCPVPLPPDPPVGIMGMRRMLHRWRRALHA